MKKFFCLLNVALVCCMAAFCLASCGDDDDEKGGLNGVFCSSAKYSGSISGYFKGANIIQKCYCISGNRATLYVNIYDKKQPWYDNETGTQVPGLSGWYYFSQQNAPQSFSVVTNGKDVVIGNSVFEYDGKNVLYDRIGGVRYERR